MVHHHHRPLYLPQATCSVYVHVGGGIVWVYKVCCTESHLCFGNSTPQRASIIPSSCCRIHLLPGPSPHKATTMNHNTHQISHALLCNHNFNVMWSISLCAYASMYTTPARATALQQHRYIPTVHDIVLSTAMLRGQVAVVCCGGSMKWDILTMLTERWYVCLAENTVVGHVVIHSYWCLYGPTSWCVP